MSGTVWPQVVLSDVNGVPYTAGNPVPITGSITATSAATATVAAPTYVEASSDALSQNLSGDLRVIAKQSGSYAVTGTFFQATQPVSGTVAISGNVAVTGTFWQATQPVSGTFWQATQPVSIAAMPSTPVTGTFWQATQPVSAASLPLPTGAALDASLATLHTDFSVAQPRAANASAATGGIASTARLASAAASTNATNVKASPGRIYSVCGKNNAGYDIFLVLYDSATSPPVPGTTTIRKKIVCPAGQAFVYDYPLGLSCANGIGYAFTKLVADADTTVLVAADVTAFNLDYV